MMYRSRNSVGRHQNLERRRDGFLPEPPEEGLTPPFRVRDADVDSWPPEFGENSFLLFFSCQVMGCFVTAAAETPCPSASSINYVRRAHP